MAKVICKDCGCIIDTDLEDYIEVGGEYVCEDCMDDYRECYECGEWYRRSDMYYVESMEEYVCDDCYCDYYFTCERCGNVEHTDNTVYVNDYGYVCDDCADWNFHYCEDCGEWYTDRDWNDEEGLCIHCAPPCVHAMKSYHYHKRFDPIFFDLAGSHNVIDDAVLDELKGFIGVEIELRTKETPARALNAIFLAVGFQSLKSPARQTVLPFSAWTVNTTALAAGFFATRLPEHFAGAAAVVAGFLAVVFLTVFVLISLSPFSRGAAPKAFYADGRIVSHIFFVCQGGKMNFFALAPCVRAACAAVAARDVLAGPAVRAQAFARDAYGGNEVVDRLER